MLHLPYDENGMKERNLKFLLLELCVHLSPNVTNSIIFSLTSGLASTSGLDSESLALMIARSV